MNDYERFERENNEIMRSSSKKYKHELILLKEIEHSRALQHSKDKE